MYQMDFENPVHVHFIGIGGISMSGLAQVLLQAHFPVSGSDARKSPLTQSLEKMGIRVYYGHRAGNLSSDTAVVVYTAAIHPDNPEYQEAVRRQIPMLTRAQLLGEIMANYPNSIAVAGTHGKTTTTSMLAHILLEAEKDPTISVGGILPSIGGNIRIGHSDNFLTEACEYMDSYLSLSPLVGIILNIDADHLDYFKDLEDIRRSFRKFALKIPQEGSLILNMDTDGAKELAEGLPCHVVTVSLEEDADYRAEDIVFDKYGRPSFDVYRGKEKAGSCYLKVPGVHNVGNALAAIAAAEVFGIGWEEISRGLAGFTGTQRRFEHKGEIGGVTIIDDYAHHPTEIEATLKAAKQVPHRKLWCVFQPHTYSRTKALMKEFCQALALADHVVLAEIYAAREVNEEGLSSRDLQERILEKNVPCEFFETFDEIENYCLAHCESGDLLLTMGAGDVVRVGEHLLGL